jgi:GLPGLI family protein
MTISFKESNFRQDMDMNMMKTTTIHNAKKEQGILLIEMMGVKKAARIESLINLTKTDSSTTESSGIEISDETRTISGYECSKVIVEDSTGMEMIMFVTNELKANNNQNKYGNSKVKGFPLSIEIEMAQLSMTMTATEVVPKVKNSVFDTAIPDGYEETSSEELMKMMSGMK